MSYKFYMPQLSLMGQGCLNEMGEEIHNRGFKRLL